MEDLLTHVLSHTRITAIFLHNYFSGGKHTLAELNNVINDIIGLTPHKLHGLEVFPDSWVQVNTPPRLHLYVRPKTASSLFPASFPFLESKKRAAAWPTQAGQLKKLRGVLEYDSLFSSTHGHRWSWGGSTKIKYKVMEIGLEAYRIEKEHKTSVLGYDSFLYKIWHWIPHLAP